MGNPAPDVQHNSQLYLSSKPGIEHFNFFKVENDNLIPACTYLAVRQCIASDWLNDRDQFLWPLDSWLADGEFQTDCLVYTLFHGQNRISCKAGVNHWIPFAEAEVGARDAYRSHFMVDFLRGKTAAGPSAHGQGNLFGEGLPRVAEARPGYGTAPALSPSARAVMAAGLALWRYYHAQPGAVPDASFYDIRGHFQGFKPNGHMNPDSPDAEYTRLITALRDAQKRLAARIAPKVRLHGFLR